MLGRRGRGAVVDAFLAEPERDWTVRALSRATGVSPMNVSRAVGELAALGVVDAFRPGRDMVVSWQADSAAARAIASFQPPDLWAESVRTFARHYAGPGALVRYQRPTDKQADPLAPARIAILTREDAWDDLDPALDAVAEAGWPRPDVIVVAKEELEGDEEGESILRGEIIRP